MSPAVPMGLSGAVVTKALERGGFEHVSTRGSHAKYRRAERTVIVPLHRNLAAGTLRSILRQAGWTVDDLEEHLR
ncbi:type II toxin-antitoxin system HicA family toxin [Streptomyces alkaliterrae]|uniref:Addiction module toxin, HicA family n=1 Tax=Streptomyces alkaliterrae TaxID=2213162 RepID=A0A5P0YPV9_9ACTN|nr:type II toxin-antitoxin system HicA family toxin [Streptomyces alkaliterrae]MBB1261289.1 type II toxin-antitoxin system HicA family toxin [Streptomyces alkaliterrae]MQS02321.1 addiction module toxin, HicA family [Streptomyces alkaliterrae]